MGVYHPMNLQDALRICGSARPQILAGGTDWMVKQKRDSQMDCTILYIGQLRELRQIYRDGEDVLIGAACTLSQLLMSPLLPEYLKQPLAQMASPAIRNVATIGGNVCNASPAADTLPMLYALDAVLHLQSAAGSAAMPVRDFILGPGKTALKSDQLLTEIRVPLSGLWRCTYRKVGMRSANSLSKLSFYALADRSAGCLQDIRIAFGAVAPTVVRCREAEQLLLLGTHSPQADTIQQVSSLYMDHIRPIDDVRSSRLYRNTVSMRLLAQYVTEEMNI